MIRVKKSRAVAAFTLIEVLMTIALVGILTASSISLYNMSLSDARFDATYKEMLQIRKALIGDLENTTIEGDRIRFGMLGDMGKVPSTSEGLAAINSKPANYLAYTFNSTAIQGMGWNGPYLVSSTSTDYRQDAWGRNYVYNGNSTEPYILSYGSDGVIGGSGAAQDITVTMPTALRTANVNGQITTSGSVFKGNAEVIIYYPALSASMEGALSSQTFPIVPANEGRFNFAGIPFGIRTVKLAVPSLSSDTLRLTPITITVDNPNYTIPNNLMEVNPQSSAVNCNTIGNVRLDTTEAVLLDGRRVSFQLFIDESFAIKTVTITTNRSLLDLSPQRIEQIGIGGVVYGCKGWIGATFDRRFNESDCTDQNKAYIDLFPTPQHTLNLNWGIASGHDLPVKAFILFDNNEVMTGLTTINLTLGCDTVTIPVP